MGSFFQYFFEIPHSVARSLHIPLLKAVAIRPMLEHDSLRQLVSAGASQAAASRKHRLTKYELFGELTCKTTDEKIERVTDAIFVSASHAYPCACCQTIVLGACNETSGGLGD